MSEILLKTENLSIARGGLPIVKGISFELVEGSWLMLAGPNGSGKSTIISGISGEIPYEGTVYYRGQDLKNMTCAQRAAAIGVLMQWNFVSYGFTVEEVVELGCYAGSKGFLKKKLPGVRERIDQALEETGLQDKRFQSVLTLSGGELQRTFLAQLFVQEPKIMFLDEPTNHLDMKYQEEIFSCVGNWLQTPGRAVLSVVHDLSLARNYGTEAILLSRGRILEQGCIGRVFSPERLKQAYDMDVYGWMNRMYSAWKQEQPWKAEGDLSSGET